MTVVWFITGASTGFGKAFAEYAIAQGYYVAVSARSFDKLTAIAATCPERVLPLRMDVTKNDEIQAALTETLKRFGHIDVLINNAGFGVMGTVEELSEADLRSQMETNFFGAVAVTKAFLPSFRAMRSGAIVNISSMAGQMTMPGVSAYSASKFALEAFSEALSMEVKQFNIKVLIVEPGVFRTDFCKAGACKMAAPIAEYEEIMGPVRTLLTDDNFAKTGSDPRKAAVAIDAALRAETTPLRLSLGADSVAAIRAHSEGVLAELAQWESTSTAMAFDEQA